MCRTIVFHRLEVKIQSQLDIRFLKKCFFNVVEPRIVQYTHKFPGFIVLEVNFRNL